jgi:YVTN family beta-propeller protein
VRKRVSVLVSAVILGSGFLVLPAGGAYADTPPTLPITNLFQMVADTAHGHLFISQGSDSDSDDIIVTNLAGTEVATITGQDGVGGLALSPDGSTLYAALSSADAVTAISTSTLKQTASYPLGNGDSPVFVAVQSGKVWVSYNTTTPGQATIGDINLSASPPAFETQAAMGGWYSAPQLAADPSGSGVLVAALPGISPATVASYNTTVDPATVRAEESPFNDCENEEDLAVAPGGSEFVLACGGSGAHYRYSTADLSQLGSYPTTAHPDAVAIDASGDVAAGNLVFQSSPLSPNVYVFGPDGTTPLNTYGVTSSSDSYLVPRGLAFAADGSAVFAVLEQTVLTATYVLQVISYPTLTGSDLALNGPNTADITEPVQLSGSLNLANGTAPVGADITITRSVQGGSQTKTFSVTTTANGQYTLTDTPPGLGVYTYTASYSGSATVAPATDSLSVSVAKLTPALTLDAGRRLALPYDSTVRLSAHLGPTWSNRIVSIYAQPAGSSRRTLLKTGKVNSSGDLTATYRATHSTLFSAVYAGDAHYAARTVTSTVYVYAKVSESQTGYYGHKRIGKVTYWLYHRKALLHAHATVAPDQHGECVQFEVQEYYNHAWNGNVTTGCVKLSRASTAIAIFTLNKANLGYPYRIRADYVPSVKDNSDLANHSVWLGFIITR